MSDTRVDGWFTCTNDQFVRFCLQLLTTLARVWCQILHKSIECILALSLQWC